MNQTTFNKLIIKYLKGDTDRDDEKQLLDQLIKFYNDILSIVKEVNQNGRASPRRN